MLAAGTRVGEYLLGRWEAEGATSEVYSGRHATEGTQVAVKVLSPAYCAHAEVVARFLNEAQILQQLRHPHLIRSLAEGVLLSENRPYMILEWHPEDLERAVKREGGRLSARDGLMVVRQLAEVLTLLHEKGVIHRDLKPANVLVVRKGPGAWRVQLADLGLAKRLLFEGDAAAALPVSTAGNALLGTREYMPPEQWRDPKRVDSRADVYSLGILWFELLAGRRPFIAEDDRQGLMFLHVLQPPPLQLLEAVASPAIRALLARMLAKKAEARPFMKEVLESLPTRP